MQQLQLIRTSVKQSSGVVGQLLAFARKQVFQPIALNLNNFVEESLIFVNRLIGDHAEVSWAPGQDLWKVKMDPAQVNQVFLNLCLNARDAISGNGHIRISTGNIHCPPDHGFTGETPCKPGDFVMLSIEDDGAGMDEETRARIFEPFFTTKPPGKGTGLGLSTVYGIVRQNDGYIEVDSAPGQGTTFRVYFPRYQKT
jgi:signal transduction histidine kinase